jgi:hypothetical protein
VNAGIIFIFVIVSLVNLVVTAAPIGFIFLPPLWTGPKFAKQLYNEQNVMS